MNIRWNAEGYTANFGFVHEYGKDVLALLDAEPGKAVVDLGCGNGALTKQLAEMGMSVIGIDASPELLRIARDTYPELTFYEADATEFILPQPVDAVFSNAVFHWIDRDKQKPLLQHIAAALRDEGELVCEFGGYGNCAKIHGALAATFARRGLPYRHSFYFPTIGEYAALMEACGLRVVFAALFERPTELKGQDGLADWIRMFVRQPFEGLDEIGGCIINEAVSALQPELYHDGKWYADYVRIRLKALKVAV